MAPYPCPSCSGSSSSPWRCTCCGGLLETRGYKVERCLGVSPRGRVYKAQGPNGAVALKELAFAVVPDTRSIDRFFKEGQVLRALDSPLVPRFLEAFEDGTGPELRLYLAQSYVEGEDLEQRLAHHFFDEEEAKGIARDVLTVLDYLHSRSPRLIHRDIKPGNILRQPDGRCTLVDFGAVSVVGRRGSTRTSVQGTFGYMPPEQLARSADVKSDLYALGVTLARLLSRMEVEELFTPELTLNARPYVNVSEELTDFIERLAHRNPKLRFASAKLALAALEGLGSRAGARPAAEGAEALLNQATHDVDLARVEHFLPRQPPGPGAPQAPAAPEPDVHWLASGRPWGRQSPGAQPWLLKINGRLFGLRPGYEYRVGRSEAMDVVIDVRWPEADSVSRMHAELRVANGHLEVRDLGSMNGTFLGSDGIRGAGPVFRLTKPATLHFGRLEATFAPADPASLSSRPGNRSHEPGKRPVRISR